MPASIRQTSFLGGELDPLLWGRTDSPLFANGMRGIRNFFVSRHGAAVSRPGTTFVGYPRVVPGAQVRLVPFVYSDTTSYCLEVGVGTGLHLYVRFFSNGAQVTATYINIVSQTGPFVVGAVLTGATSAATATLIAEGDGRLQINPISGTFVSGEIITSPPAGSATTSGVTYDAPFEVWAGTVPSTFDIMKLKYAQTGDILTLAHPDFVPQELRRLPDVGAQPKWTLTAVPFVTAAPWFNPANRGYPVVLTPLPVADATHPARQWDFWVTLTVRDNTTQKLFETRAWLITEGWDDIPANLPIALGVSSFALYPDRPMTVSTRLHAETAAGTARNSSNTTYTVEAVNVYRGRGALVGFVGSTQYAADLNGLVATLVDLGAEPDYASPPPRGTLPFVSGTYPYAVAFFQERLVFGGTRLSPTGLWASATGDYRNFDLPQIVHHAGESLLFELAARRFEQVVHLFPDAKLLVFTASSVWSVAGDQGNALDFDHVDARIEDNVGSSNVPPVAIDGAILFARTKGFGVRALSFDGRVYAASGVSHQSQHLLLGEVYRHRTIGGVDVAYGPYGKELIDWAYAEDPWGTLWAVRDDGALLSMTHVGESFAWARHDTEGWVTRVCAVPEADEDAVYLLVEREVSSTIVNRIERMTSRVRRGNVGDDACVDSAVRFSGAPTLTITGLTHLVGKQVWAVAMGNAPVGPLTVSGGGTVTLPALPVANSGANVVMYVGLPFTAELETLDAVSTDARLKQKNVVRVGFEVDNSTGVMVGQSFDALSDSRPNTVESGYVAPSAATALLTVNVDGRWNQSARAVLRQTLPLPVTVVGITRELEAGG